MPTIADDHEMKAIFFYGLFMDISLLREKGFSPSEPVMAYVDGFGLRIGERATLVKSKNERAYGLVMTLSDEDVTSLYNETSVADYVPEKVHAFDTNNNAMEAIVYNLPKELLSGRNISYAHSLAVVAKKAGLPTAYINEIEGWAS
ncbi:hypothetical protein [Emcibacter sp.]|uniref:hypothetical protein n=1 Tax=Emcibacter sp. TaxID=1979954 RepID=UPI003A95C599